MTSSPTGTSTLEPTPATTPSSAPDAFQESPSGRAWQIVTAREISVKLRDRGFFLSTVVTLALIVGAIAVQAFIGVSQDKITVAATGPGSAEVVQQAVALAEQAGEDVRITSNAKSSEGEVEDAVRAGEVDAGLVPTADGWRLLGKTDQESAASIWIGAAVQQLALARNAAAAGTTVADLQRGAAVDYVLLSPGDTPQMVVRVAAYLFGFLFYLAAVLFGVAIATSVVEEKQNRIVEIIASAIPLRALLVGKVAGNSILALAQLVLFIAAGAVGLVAMGKSDVLNQVTLGIGWFVVFFVIGFALLACVYAAAGAVSTRTEDIQATTTPISAVTAVVFIAGISASGTFQTVLSFIPLSSTIAMPARMVAGDTAWWEPVASLVISLVAAAVLIMAGARVYRRSLMQTGRKLSFRQALKLPE
ncbi:ABC transporter permease [Micromonospora sp. SL4-19]|uniref:ABC transporter permease n=1 Tax=Micromonospora sp. SL4-19 TaxID=3399129 RepID=UPI003A4D238F